jgi:hypothetical protein
MEALNQGTNDLVTWSNDIFSYNVEQSRGDTHNMIVILMLYHGHTLQSAVDYVGDLCAQTIDTFCENKKKLPSWGPEVDEMVAKYVQGLQDWIVGYANPFPCHTFLANAFSSQFPSLELPDPQVFRY